MVMVMVMVIISPHRLRPIPAVLRTPRQLLGSTTHPLNLDYVTPFDA
jgi:hypothetical protein